MKKRLKDAWDRLPKRSRRWQTARNLALCVLLLALLPVLLDWPAFTRKQAILRLAEMSLLSPCEIVLEVGEDGFLLEGEDFVAAGRVDKYDNAWKPLQKLVPRLCHVVPKEGLTVIGVPVAPDSTLTIAATGLPGEAAAGRLDVTVSDIRGYKGGTNVADSEAFTAQALRDGDWMVFRLEPHAHPDGWDCILEEIWWDLTLNRGLSPYPWTLELLDEDGRSLGVMSGTLPRDMVFLDQRMFR